MKEETKEENEQANENDDNKPLFTEDPFQEYTKDLDKENNNGNSDKK